MCVIRAIGGVNRETEEKTFGLLRCSSSLEKFLADFFAPYGKIVDCILMRHPETKKSRGFGFVTYEDNESVEKVFFLLCFLLPAKSAEAR